MRNILSSYNYHQISNDKIVAVKEQAKIPFIFDKRGNTFYFSFSTMILTKQILDPVICQ